MRWHRFKIFQGYQGHDMGLMNDVFSCAVHFDNIRNRCNQWYEGHGDWPHWA